ncbi:MAG: hypothetical protein Q9197_002315 [Variospora fuerteventurae]
MELPRDVEKSNASLSSSPSSPSDRPTLYDDRDVSAPLSDLESASLDHSISFLDREYDYQRQLIAHYSKARGHPREQIRNAQHTGQYFPSDPSQVYGKGRQSLPARLPLYTGMDSGFASEKGYRHNAYTYQRHLPRRPLVDFAGNRRRAASLSPPHSPRFSVAPSWEEHRLLNDALDEKVRKGTAWYGLNLRPAFMDMIQLERLDVGELPQEDGKRRLIFIGDVHGCYAELQALVTETKYNNHTDHIVFAGDLISKGPDSSRVVDFAINNSASCVRGDHEDRILLAHRDLKTHRISLPGRDEDNVNERLKPPSPGDPALDYLDEESFSHGDYFDRKFAKSLSPEQASYLMSCPLILELGDLPVLGRSIVAHAGLVPGVQLENQDPVGVMNMRTVDLKTHVPSRSNSGTPWFKLWNKYQSFLPSKDRSTVIYAHDSRRGLQQNSYSKGLDSGCASGGKLTAFILTIKNDGKAEQQVVSVKCKNYGGLKGKGRGWDDIPVLATREDNH